MDHRTFGDKLKDMALDPSASETERAMARTLHYKDIIKRNGHGHKLEALEKMGPEEIKEFLLSFWADQAKEHPIVSRKE